MLHLIYIFAFTVLAFLAVANLIRNLITLGAESQKTYSNKGQFSPTTSTTARLYSENRVRTVSHPELLDEAGNIVNEPFLVMRSITVEDAREQLDAIYRSSPNPNDSGSSES
jgi:hypothetical protein